MAAFVGGSMGSRERASIDAHVDRCDACRRLVAHLAGTSLARPPDWQPRSTIPAGPRDPLQPRLAAGARIGRYELGPVLGRGAMGVVYLAYDPELDRQLAVKLLRGGRSGASRASLGREARAMARAAHPNLLPIFDVGTEDGEVFIAMERVEGQTLRHWLEARERPWREILATVTAAGRGLAAAHAAGVIHRDFKPDNVLVSRDGRVLVMDFGLARQQADAGESGFTTRGSIDPDAVSGITGSGAIVGTPAYMAPEQLRGEVADERSDQFGFCVSLYEALAGERPFAADRLEGLEPAIQAGAKPLPRSLPAWLRDAVTRGLDPVPSRRHDSMADLVSVLEGPRRRATPALLGFAGLFVVSAAAAWAASVTPSPETACDRGATEVESLWTASQRSRARANAPQSAFADEALERIHSGLEAYKRDWVTARDDLCAPSVPASERDRQMACLRGRLSEVEALAEVLATADGNALEHGVRAVQNLQSPDDCQASAAVEPGSADAVAGIRRQLATADAQRSAGQFEVAVATALQAKELGQAVDHAPVHAQAGVVLGRALEEVGRFGEAEQALSEAYWIAIDAGVDGVAEDAAVRLGYVIGAKAHRPDAAQRWFKHAEAIRFRLGDPTRRRSRAAHNLGAVLQTEGRYPEARSAYEEAAELRRADEDALGLAMSLNNLGATLNRQGNQARAIDLHREVLEIRRARLGPSHPDLAQSLINLGNTFNRAGDLDAAVENLDAALAILEGALPHDHVRLAEAFHNLGGALLRQGNLDRAQSVLERGLEIHRAQPGPEGRGVASILNNLSGVDIQRGNWNAAERKLERAAEIIERTLGSQHPELGTTLLNLGSVLMIQQRYDAAQKVYERVLEILPVTLGPKHPHVATVLDYLGGVATELDDFTTAAEYYGRALEIRREAPEPDSPAIAGSLGGLGIAQFGSHDFGPAHKNLTEALALSKPGLPDPGVQPTIRWFLAQTTWRLGQRAQARALAETARTELEAAGPQYALLLGDVTRWLATHR